MLAHLEITSIRFCSMDSKVLEYRTISHVEEICLSSVNHGMSILTMRREDMMGRKKKKKLGRNVHLTETNHSVVWCNISM